MSSNEDQHGLNRIRSMRRRRNIKRGAIALICTAFLVVAFVVFTSVASSKSFARGNQTVWDNNYTFDKAIINTFDGKIEVKVRSWNEWDDSHTMQIITKDGEVYYTSSENVVLKKSK